MNICRKSRLFKVKNRQDNKKDLGLWPPHIKDVLFMFYLLCGLKKVVDFKASIHLIYCHATHLLFIFDEIKWICLIGAFARHEWHPWRELLPGELSATDFAVVFACICIISHFYLYLYLYWCDQDICGAAMAVWSEGPPGGCPCLPLTLARRS